MRKVKRTDKMLSSPFEDDITKVVWVVDDAEPAIIQLRK